MGTNKTDSKPERFSQRNVGFNRQHWDEEHPARGKKTRSPNDEIGRPRPYHAPEDFALQAGAWAVARRAQGIGELWEPKEGVEPDYSDPGRLTTRAKEAARFYGATMVGVARVDPRWIYETDGNEAPIELPEGVETAVAIGVPMDYELMRSAPSALAAASTGNGYSRMAFATTCTAQFLTELGFRAMPCGNDTGLSIPLAVDAGLGECGRNGMLITRELGPRVRLCKVFTDAPLAPDEPVGLGVREFCDDCLKCCDECPANAITRGGQTTEGPTPSNHAGIKRWFVDPDKCLSFWRVSGVSCSSCIRSCPFNKPKGRIHEWARALVERRSPSINRVLLGLDNALGYGKRLGGKW